MIHRVAAIDLGASSGRVSVVEIGHDHLRVDCVHRFACRTLALGDDLVWDIHDILTEVEKGLAAAAATGCIDSVGIDSWGCDYGLLRPSGGLTGPPACYRSDRTTRPDADGRSAVDRVHDLVPPAALYAATGTQFEPFNTVYQLAADAAAGRLRDGDTVLMIPDLVAHRLTGRVSAEVTSASTTGLTDPAARRLDAGLLTTLAERLGAPAPAWPPLREPGAVIGPITAPVAERTRLAPGTPVIAVASHDTASAFTAVPHAPDDGFAAYLSSGTWSLIGVELDAPVVTPASQAANFTNELGVAGTVRFLRNVMGRWVLDECVRAWAEPLDAILIAAATQPGGLTFDIDHPSLLRPGADMPERVARLAGRDDLPPAHMARAILDSLATAYARAVATVTMLTGRTVESVHVVGGGSRDRLLCQLTADTTGLPVIAGPAEATTIGNALLQAWRLERPGDDTPGSTPTRTDLDAMRALVRRTQPVTTYTPRP